MKTAVLSIFGVAFVAYCFYKAIEPIYTALTKALGVLP